MKRLICVSLLVIASMMVTSVYGQQKEDFTTYTYKTIQDTLSLQLDVFMPEEIQAGDKRPVMVFFHGGGWVGGKRSLMHRQCRYFAQRGFITATVTYRLLTKGVPGDKSICIKDAKSAIRWIKQQAADLHADTGKVILGGGSAGGHLATMAALDTAINDEQDDISISTKALALILFNPAYGLQESAAVQPFDKVNPQCPPVIQFFGDLDAKWKPGGDKFRQLLVENKVRNEMWIAKGQKHGFYGGKGWSIATVVQADHFLVAMGILKGPVRAGPANAPLVLSAP